MRFTEDAVQGEHCLVRRSDSALTDCAVQI